MRIGLALCLVAGSTLIGKSLATSAHRRTELLKGAAAALRILRIHIVSMFEPVQNSLEQSDCLIFKQVGQKMCQGMSARTAWQEMKPRLRRRGGLADSLTSADEQVLDAIFEQLGQSGREAQDILLTGAIQSLDASQESARVLAAEADRLYVALGLLIGLMMALVIL